MGKKKISEFATVTPIGTDLFLIERADGSYKSVLSSSIGGGSQSFSDTLTIGNVMLNGQQIESENGLTYIVVNDTEYKLDSVIGDERTYLISQAGSHELAAGDGVTGHYSSLVQSVLGTFTLVSTVSNDITAPQNNINGNFTVTSQNGNNNLNVLDGSISLNYDQIDGSGNFYLKDLLGLTHSALIELNAPDIKITNNTPSRLQILDANGFLKSGTKDEQDLINDISNAQINSEAYADGLIASLIGTSPLTLDTLQEIATALQNNPNVVGEILTALGNRLRFDINNQGLSLLEKQNAKTNIDLQNVDNTSDVDKPVSTAQQTALNLKEDLSNKNNTVLNASATEYPTSGLVKNNIEYNIINTSVALTVLTNASRFKTVHIGSTFNSKVNLPNATTLTNGVVIEAVNDSLETVVYYAANGTTEIGRVYPSCTLKLVLKDNTTSNGVWNSQLITSDKVKTFFDDFGNVIGGVGIGEQNWGGATVGTGSTILTTTSVSNTVGRVRITAGTTATGSAGILQSVGMIRFSPANTLNEGVRVFEGAMNIALLSTVLNSAITNIGIGNVNNAAQTDGVYFVYDLATSPNWILRTTRTGVSTSIITTIPVSISNVKLRCEVNNRTMLAEFFINDVFAGSITTNIPNVSTSLVAGIRKTIGGTSIALNIDYMKFTQYFPR